MCQKLKYYTVYMLLIHLNLFMSTGNSQKALEDVLDTCMLSDEEMKQYEETVALGSDLNLKKLYFPER